MGSPASPILADLVMEKLLDVCMEKFTTKPQILTKYVDDLFAIVRDDAIMESLTILNSFNDSIKFTLEEENNYTLPYLDTAVTRDNGKIKVDWYQKPTASGRIINFHSKHPKRMIINTAKNLVNRVLSISDEEYHSKNKIKISNILKKNCFPGKIITELINKFTEQKRTNDETNKENNIYKSLIYIPNMSERLEKSNIFNKNQFTVAHKTNNNLRTIFSNIKSKIPLIEKHNVVYEIKCDGNSGETCGKVYVGTTKNKLKTRLSAHKSDMKLRNNNLMQKTALANHCKINNHSPNLDNVRILQRENNYNKRMTSEMLHIVNIPTNKRINFKRDIEGNCAQSYRHLLEKTRSKDHIRT